MVPPNPQKPSGLNFTMSGKVRGSEGTGLERSNGMWWPPTHGGPTGVQIYLHQEIKRDGQDAEGSYSNKRPWPASTSEVSFQTQAHWLKRRPASQEEETNKPWEICVIFPQPSLLGSVTYRSVYLEKIATQALKIDGYRFQTNIHLQMHTGLTFEPR